MTERRLFTMTETAGQLAITVDELLALVQAGEIRYSFRGLPRPDRWQIEDIDRLSFEQRDIDRFNEGFPVSVFADRLGVPEKQVWEAIEDGDVAVTTLDDGGRYAKPRQRILRADFKRAAEGFRRWHKRSGA
jgi:hypothetical protein